MTYKVFLVEDEIVTREGIRDNVNWQGIGWEFCGEASDGEMALPFIQAKEPDVLITDIRMPFMDGLQLSHIVREQLPDVKIIILSGHDEFEYAQEAVKLGITEYLLKPISVKDLQDTLLRVAEQLDVERRKLADVQVLEAQVVNTRAALRDKFLLRLVMGGVSAADAIERSQDLGLDILSPYYLVLLLKIDLNDGLNRFDYQTYQDTVQLLGRFLEDQGQELFFRKDLEEIVLILKGEQENDLVERAERVNTAVCKLVSPRSDCTLRVGIGSAQVRFGGIHQSYVDALMQIEADKSRVYAQNAPGSPGIAELLKMDTTAVAEYLRLGIKEEFDEFFQSTYIQPLGEAIFSSRDIKNFIFSDVVLTTAKFVEELGGHIEEIIPDMEQLRSQWLRINSFAQLRLEIEKIVLRAISYRDDLSGNQYAYVINAAKTYIDDHYTDPELTLKEVAQEISFSTSYFSTLFARETGETFKEYLTGLRIHKAQELLRTTNLKSFEIARQVGYSDPHYFSHVFSKQTGQSPKQYRSLTS